MFAYGICSVILICVQKFLLYSKFSKISLKSHEISNYHRTVLHPKPRSTFRIVTPVVVLVSTRGLNPRAPLPTEENGPKSAPLGLVFVQLHEGAHVPLRLTNPRPRCCYCHSLSVVVVVVVARTSRCLCVFPDRLVNRFQFAASSNKNNNNNTRKSVAAVLRNAIAAFECICATLLNA